jgi:hypothetical protein
VLLHACQTIPNHQIHEHVDADTRLNKTVVRVAHNVYVVEEGPSADADGNASCDDDHCDSDCNSIGPSITKGDEAMDVSSELITHTLTTAAEARVNMYMTQGSILEELRAQNMMLQRALAQQQMVRAS